MDRSASGSLHDAGTGSARFRKLTERQVKDVKLLHVGDLHFGKTLGEFDLYEDQRFIIDRILDLAKEHKVDAVLAAGDIYDRSTPSDKAVRLLDYFLVSLTEAGLPLYMIAGNHDSGQKLGFGSSLFKTSGIHIASSYQGELEHYTLNDEYGPVSIYLLPFVKSSYVRSFHPEAEIENYQDAVQTVLEQAGIDPEARNVLVAHQFVTGGRDPEMAGSESKIPEAVGTVERISADCFHDFDYVALGHIHSPQQVGRPEIRYAGSPLKYSLSEAGHTKTVPIITLGPEHQTEVELVPLTPMRDLRHLRGPLKTLLQAEHITDARDFIYVTLTDEDIVNDAMGIIRQYYPNTVRLDFDNSRTREIEQIEPSDASAAQTFTELISSFYREIYGTEISEEELELMKDAAVKAGVEDETR